MIGISRAGSRRSPVAVIDRFAFKFAGEEEPAISTKPSSIEGRRGRDGARIASVSFGPNRATRFVYPQAVN